MYLQCVQGNGRIIMNIVLVDTYICIQTFMQMLSKYEKRVENI